MRCEARRIVKTDPNLQLIYLEKKGDFYMIYIIIRIKYEQLDLYTALD